MHTRPENYYARIEVSRGSFVKGNGNQTVDFFSPIPCPYNYGSLEGTLGEDGEPVDAVVLGPTLPLGERIHGALVGVVYFRDAGLLDDKLILRVGGAPLSARERFQLGLFFRVYATIKKAANRLRLRPSPTAFEGIGDAPRQTLSPSAQE